MDFGGLYIVDISKNSQDPPPEDSGRVRMPADEAPASNDTAVISEELAAVCERKNVPFP